MPQNIFKLFLLQYDDKAYTLYSNKRCGLTQVFHPPKYHLLTPMTIKSPTRWQSPTETIETYANIEYKNCIKFNSHSSHLFAMHDEHGTIKEGHQEFPFGNY